LKFMLERLLDRARDGQFERGSALGGVAQAVVEGALDAGAAIAVDIGVAKDVGGKRGLRVEAVGLARQGHARFAKCIDRIDQPGRSATAR
jgi:hypothetical protein